MSEQTCGKSAEWTTCYQICSKTAVPLLQLGRFLACNTSTFSCTKSLCPRGGQRESEKLVKLDGNFKWIPRGNPCSRKDFDLAPFLYYPSRKYLVFRQFCCCKSFKSYLWRTLIQNKQSRTQNIKSLTQIRVTNTSHLIPSPSRQAVVGNGTNFEKV